MTWDDALAFCKWLSSEEHGLCRLPTEAEWEYACRAGTTTPYFFGDSETSYREYAWKGVQISSVGLMKPNAFGLHDTLGNVHEWYQGCFAANYCEQSPLEDPMGPEGGTYGWCEAAVTGTPSPTSAVHTVNTGCQQPILRLAVFAWSSGLSRE